MCAFVCVYVCVCVCGSVYLCITGIVSVSTIHQVNTFSYRDTAFRFGSHVVACALIHGHVLIDGHVLTDGHVLIDGQAGKTDTRTGG